MSLIVTISGLHGTGKSTYAREVAKKFGLRHISAGELFRQIAVERHTSLGDLSREAEKNDELDHLLDERTRSEIRRGGVVIDGLLVGWFARKYNVPKIFLSAPYTIRIGRIASRDTASYAEADRATTLRENIERRRFKRLYDIDIDDLSIYDLVLNTSLLCMKFNVEVVLSFIDGYIKSHGVK